MTSEEVDLDDLLDGALDELDDQEEKNNREKEEAAAALLEEQNAAASMGGGFPGAPEGTSAEDAKMIAQLQSLLGSLGNMNPNEELSDSQMADMQKVLAEAVGSLKEGASEEDQAELAKCDGLLAQLAAAEQNAKDGKEVGGDEGEAHEPSEEEVKALAEQMEKFKSEMEKIQAEAAKAAKEGQSEANGTPGAPPAATADAAGSNKDAEAEALEAAMRMLADPNVIAEPFRNIRGKYGPWLEANGSSLSSEERTRYEKQYELVKQICEGLDQGHLSADKVDTPQQGALLKLIEELQALGAPPESMVQQA